MSRTRWKRDVESLISSLKRKLDIQQQEARQAEEQRQLEAAEIAQRPKEERQEAERGVSEAGFHESKLAATQKPLAESPTEIPAEDADTHGHKIGFRLAGA